ncbi:hypothetical protein AWQ23_14065 [Picosynechococcus sp. PCC 73109]|nr:hypothetical protein AWQ23_14065 [Picosynechococcus sp. PCC 73109]
MIIGCIGLCSWNTLLAPLKKHPSSSPQGEKTPSGLSVTSLIKGGFFLDGSKSGTGQENFWDWVATMMVIKAIALGAGEKI